MRLKLVLLNVFFSLILQSTSDEINSFNGRKLIGSRSILDVYYRTFYPDYKFLREDYMPKYHDYNPYHGYNYRPFSYGFTYEYIPNKYDYPSKVNDKNFHSPYPYNNNY